MSERRSVRTTTASPRRGARARRRAVTLVGLFVALWIAFVFAGSLARTSDLEAQLSEALARTTALEERVDAGYAELEFVETEAYLGFASRGLGLGMKDEQAFALPKDAPPPRPVPTIGVPRSGTTRDTSLGGWLDDLLGRG